MTKEEILEEFKRLYKKKKSTFEEHVAVVPNDILVRVDEGELPKIVLDDDEESILYVETVFTSEELL